MRAGEPRERDATAMRRVDHLRLRDQDDAVIGGIAQRTVGGFFLKDIRQGVMDHLRIQVPAFSFRIISTASASGIEKISRESSVCRSALATIASMFLARSRTNSRRRSSDN